MSEFENQPTTKLPESGYIRLPEILKLLKISKSTWWAGVKSGKYPKPVKIATRISAWKVQDIRNLR